MAEQAHLANTVDLTFVGRYIIPIIVPVVIGALGLLMLDEVLNDDDDDDDEAGKVGHVLPHILPHHEVGHYVAPPAVSTGDS